MRFLFQFIILTLILFPTVLAGLEMLRAVVETTNEIEQDCETIITNENISINPGEQSVTIFRIRETNRAIAEAMAETGRAVR
jgi:hypothetical protein